VLVSLLFKENDVQYVAWTYICNTYERNNIVSLWNVASDTTRHGSMMRSTLYTSGRYEIITAPLFAAAQSIVHLPYSSPLMASK
jgi:hypothetical protein